MSFRLLRIDWVFPLNFLSFGLFGVDELSLESMIVLFEVLVGVGGGLLTRFGKRSDSGCVSMLVVRLEDVSR